MALPIPPELLGCLDRNGKRVARRVYCMFRAEQMDLWKRICWRLFRYREWTVRVTRPQFLSVTGRYREFADLYAIHEVFGLGVYCLGSVAVRPTHIIDAGAHIGCFSLLAKAVFGDLPAHAFEPSSANFKLLQRNLRANGAMHVRAHQLALFNREGRASLAGPSSMGGRVCEGSGEAINLARLSKLNLVDPDSRLLMKVDVEGSEWELLADVAPALPWDVHLFVETHDGAADRERMRVFAREHELSITHTSAKAEGCNEWTLQRGVFAAAHCGACRGRTAFFRVCSKVPDCRLSSSQQ